MKPLPPVPHLMLLANAGSGKTFNLTMRTIALLARGVEPRRIAALTFTKKAAGEFLEKVFLHLAEAARGDEAARALQKQIAAVTELELAEPLTAQRCQALLRVLVDQLGELGFGTIDGLFARLARAFPFEAGLPGDFSILDEAGRLSVRRQILARFFRQAAADPDSFAGLVDLIRRQNRTQAERAVFQSMETLVEKLHESYLSTPPGIGWGDAKAIWPVSPRPSQSLERALDEFRSSCLSANPALAPDAREILDAFCRELGSLVPGQTLTKATASFIKSKLAGEAKSGSLRLTKTKTGFVPVTPEVEEARKALLRVLWWREIEQLLRRSRALHDVLSVFDNLYQDMIRAVGQMTFSDVAHLLAGQAASPHWASLVGYRLDGKFDHWLLDEFQDTSRLQWTVLWPLIDEVLQDTEERRTFYYVGDTKQAIYRWRGGDPTLFFSIASHYNQNRTVIEKRELADSQRSCQAILDGVNAVFGRAPEEICELMGWPEATAADWRQAWVAHKVAARNRKMAGCFSWQRVEEESDEEEEQEENSGGEIRPRDREILNLLEQIEPWKRDLTCAILLRDNKSVGSLAAILQSRGVPVAVEGQTNPCLDNPLGAALHAGFLSLASPGDALSALVFTGSPLGRALPCASGEEFRMNALQVLVEQGCSGLVRHWLSFVDLENEPFLAERAEKIRSVAAIHDGGAGPERGPLDFARCMESYRSQENEAPGTVRLMTVHQAKGLTFSMTILAGLDEMVRDRFSGEMHLGGEDRIRWGLLWPAREWTDVDDTLHAERQNMMAKSAYEALCLTYVACTRASSGLYIFTKKLGEKSSARTLDRLLAHTLGERAGDQGCLLGESRWFENS